MDEHLSQVPAVLKTGYVSGVFALVASGVAYINLQLGTLVWVVLAIIAFRYFYTLIAKQNARDIVQDAMQYSIILAASAYLQGQFASDVPNLLHGLVAALLLHEIRLTIPILTSLLTFAGDSKAAADAQAIEATIESKINPAKFTGTGGTK
jgi:hypothetical protein